jgi:hypothetical protein
MMWSVQLAGDHSTLERLSSVLRAPEVTVERSGTDFVLRSTRFDGYSGAGEVLQEAAALLEGINGTLALLYGAFGTIRSGAVIREGSGTRSVAMHVGAVITTASLGAPTVRIEHPDGTVEIRDPLDFASDWIVTSLGSDAMRKALRLRAAGDPSWVNLYRILEVVMTEVPAGALVSKGWATKTDIERFKHTANSVSAAGDAARHGKEDTLPPKKPMQLSEARSLIDGILREWLSSSRPPAK